MNIFTKLLRIRKSADLDPDLLHEQLFNAAARDRKKFEALCRQHTAKILQVFAQWRTVPDSIRDNSAWVEQYGNGLMDIATYFAEALGRRELIDQLTDSAESNPILQWQDSLTKADTLIEQRRYIEAAELLQTLLTQVQQCKGSAVDEYLPLIYGRLGNCHFQIGECQLAKTAIERALFLCEERNDVEGIVTYLGNLYELFRYVEDADGALARAVRVAGILEEVGTEAQAQYWQRKIDHLRRGEPLNRVVADINGQRYEIEDVPMNPAGDTHLDFVFERNRIPLGASTAAVEEGKKLGSAGKYADALDLFQRAATVDPYNPDPHYQAAITLMNLRRYTEAIDEYARVEQLAPGWFHCRSEMWLAGQLAIGNVSHQTFLAISELEDGSALPPERVRLAEAALQRTPSVASLHLLYGENLEKLGDRKQAEVEYRKGLACAEEPDVQTCLLVRLAGLLETDDAERQRLLDRAMALKGNLVAHATANLLMRSGRVN